MSISPIVDERYRLRPGDLGRSRVPVTIQNVSWQGVEQLDALLHLREFPQKRLRLRGPQVQRLIDLVGSTQEREWIGHTLCLLVQYEDGEPTITLQPFTHSTEPTRQVSVRPQWQSIGRTLLLLLLVVVIAILVFLLENSGSLWQRF